MSFTLSSLNEKSLITDSSYGEEVYRFYWHRSFHPPISLRINNEKGIKTLVLKQVSVTSDRKPDKLITDVTRIISDSEWEQFNRLLSAACYWQLKTDKEFYGIDGANWVMEGKKSGRYYFYFVWSPQEGKFRDACLYLLKLSQLNIKPEEIY